MKRALVLMGLALAANMTFAAGFEKTIMWGGQTSGVAGIATPYINGSTAVYFNPAGLANGATGSNDVALNVSPTWSTFKSPVFDGSKQETSSNHMTIPGAITYSHKLNENLGLGIGYYASGGAYADYTGVKAAGIAGDFEAKTDLAVTEVGLGAGYKVMDNLNVGLEYRVVMAKASLAKPQSVPSVGVAQLSLDDLTGTNATAFKLGAQYKLGKTDIGFTYRSDAIIHAKGMERVVLHTNAVSYNQIGYQGVTVGTDLPAAWTLGVRHACTETWNFMAEYNLTEYSKVDNISVQTDDGKSTPIVLKMHDQHLIRLAGEYTGLMLPVRFGVIYGSQVSNSDPALALATGTPPGPAYVGTIGTGYAMASWRVDGGFEYNMVKGTADTQSAAHETNAYGFHLGGSYTF